MLLKFCILRKKKYVLLMFQKLIRKLILLITPNEEKEGWHYLVVKKLSTLLRGITSKHQDDFNCLNCLHSYRTENKLQSHEKGM